MKRIAVLYVDGSMNVMGRRRLQGKSPLECAVEECAGGNENRRRKSERCRVVELDVSNIKDVFK